MSTKRIRMIFDNLWDQAELTAGVGTEVATMPLSHSQRYGHSEMAVIEPNLVGVSVINFEMPDLVLADALIIYRHFLSNASQVRLELFDGTGQTGVTVLDTGVIDAVETKTLGELEWLVDPLVSSVFDTWPYKFTQFWFELAFFKSGRLTIIDDDAPEGVHKIDRIYMGRSVSPTVNFSYGHSHKYESDSTPVKTAGAGVYSVANALYRRFSYQLRWLDELDRPVFSRGVQVVGTDKDWFVSMHPQEGGQKEVEYAMACKFEVLPDTTNDFHNNYSQTHAIREA